MKDERVRINQLIEGGRHFCIAPWLHLHITVLGNMAPCCFQEEGPQATGFGNLNDQSFAELWQGEEMGQFRLKMLADEMVPQCLRCYNDEKHGLQSYRQYLNAKYQTKLDWVVNTDSDGVAPDARPVSWDVRFSNLCNLRCRTCCSSSSSSWVEDERKLGLLDETFSSVSGRGIKNPAGLLRDLEPYLPDLEYVNFVGGEPLLIKEDYLILQKLANLRKFDVELMYTTNLTQLNFNHTALIDLWKHFPQIVMEVSIDGWAGRGEYLRKGIKWDELVENIRKIKQECPQIILNLCTVVSAFNILHIPDLHRELVQNGLISAERIFLNLLQVPEYYNIKILPADLKKAATEKWTQHLDWVLQQAPFKENRDAESCQQLVAGLNACLDQLNSDDWTGLIPQFKERTAKLDQIRQESCVAVFPELAALFA